MLDQNTDRMWYVIGAVIVGAAIILILNGTMPELFASVADTFEKQTSDTTEVTDGIFPQVRGNGINLLDNPHYAIDGEFNRMTMPHGSRAVSNSIFTGTVTTGESQWAKRLEKYVEFEEAGVYTYSMRAKIDTQVKDLVAMDFVNGQVEINGTYKRKTESFDVDRNAYIQPILHGDWATYSVTFSVPEAGSTKIRLYIPFAVPGDTILVDWEKLERGTVATPL